MIKLGCLHATDTAMLSNLKRGAYATTAATLAAHALSIRGSAMFAFPKLGLHALGAALLWACAACGLCYWVCA